MENHFKPNILVLMSDQLQRKPLDPDHLCRTPNFDKIRNRGVSFDRAYTPNPVCSPARASLMTGLLPHNHGVLWVTHTMDKDQGVLRKEHSHFAQDLQKNGYVNGYFGKWHVEHSENPSDYGWDVNGSLNSKDMKAVMNNSPHFKDNLISSRYLHQEGYKNSLFYGVTSVPPEKRHMGLITDMALEFLKEQSDDPWCCFVSVPEPHDPFVCGEKAYEEYAGLEVPLPENMKDDMSDKPGLYRRSAKILKDVNDDEWREATRCYYASITEIDSQYGRIMNYLEQTGQLENTLAVCRTLPLSKKRISRIQFLA